MNNEVSREEAFYRSERILRTWIDPREGDTISWSVYVTYPVIARRRAFIRRLRNVPEDRIRIAEDTSFVRLEYENCYWSVLDCEIEPAEFDSLMEEGNKYLIPILGFTDGKGRMHADIEDMKADEEDERRKGYYSSTEAKPRHGATYGISLYRNVATVSLTWWQNQPDEWRDFICWSRKLQDFCERGFAASHGQQ